MGSARDELAERAAMARWLEDREHDRPDPEPARVKTPCRNCPTLCWGDVCRNCVPSGNRPSRLKGAK